MKKISSFFLAICKKAGLKIKAKIEKILEKNLEIKEKMLFIYNVFNSNKFLLKKILLKKNSFFNKKENWNNYLSSLLACKSWLNIEKIFYSKKSL